MQKLLFAAVAVGLISASCSGRDGAGAIPSAAVPNSGPAKIGAHTTRAKHPRLIPSGWAATGTGALNLSGASNVAEVPANQRITVRVGMQLRNVDQLKSAIAGGTILSPSAFAAAYGPTAGQVTQVENYLRAQGLTEISVAPNNLIVSGTGTPAQIASAFDTKLQSFTLSDGVSYYGNSQPAFVPQSLAGSVVAVLGLNNAPAAKTQHHRSKGTPSPAPVPTATPTPSPSSQPCTASEEGVCARFYDPPSFQIVYDAANAPTAANTSIAIMTEGQLSTAIADFRTNEQKFGMPQVPVSIVQVGAQSSDTSGNGEWTLDMTYSTGIAAKVKMLYVYNFPSLSDADMVMGYNRWVTDDVAPIANSSFGGCEAFPYTDGAMLVADEVLVQAAAQGQTMFASTGDNGGYCNNLVDTNGAPGGAPMVEYPAASPYAVAVGGTDLFSNPDGTYLGETGWEAGGGGNSLFEYSPSWESPTQPVGTTPAGYSFRGLPDVAMDASLETGALLWESGSAVNGSCTPCTTGGTSLASPLAAGSYARMQSSHGNALGFAAIRFYKIYASNPSASETSGGPPPTQLVGGFHDILAGSNGIYPAAPRYDYVTGMGSFDVVKTNAIVGQ